MQSEEQFREFMENAPVARVTSASGEVTDLTGRQAREMGLSGHPTGTSTGAPIYKTDSGWSMNAEDATASVSLNKDTGNVKVDAPKAFFNSESYQTKIKPVLETISQNYKLNDQYKYALLNGEDDTKTSEDWLREIQKDVSSMVSGALANERAKREIFERDGVQLNDAQLIKMSSVALERQPDGSVVQVKDDTVQSLPEMIKNLAAFKNLNGWQNGEVTYKDLMESWNRENTSDEDILQVYDTVEEYFKERNFDDADEYAEMVAFSQFISGKRPETGFWRGAWDIVSDTFYNVWSGLAKFDVEILNLLEGIQDADLPGEQNFIRDYLAPELESQVKAFQTNSIKLNDVAGSIGAITHELTPLFMQMAVGNALGGAVAKGVGSVASKLIAKTGKAATLGAELGMTAEQVATSALNGTNFLMRIMSAKKANDVIASSVKTLKAMQSATAVVSTAADLAAQIVVDVAVQDSKLARQLIEGNVSNEVKEYVLEQIALDAGGWVVAAGSMKLVKGAANTDVGRIVNASVVPRVNKWAAKIGGYTDAIKTNIIHSGDANWNKTKADRLRNRLEAQRPEGWTRNRLENRIGAAERRQQNLTNRRIERIARRNVGEISGPFSGASGWSDIVENANRIRRQADEQFIAAHALADRVYKNDVSARVTRIKNDVEALSKSMNDYTTQLAKVLKAEDIAGFKRAGKAMDTGRGGVLSQISKESNEYVNGMYRLQLGRDAKPEMQRLGQPTVGVDQEIEYYKKATKAFRESNPELAESLDELLALGKKFSAATEDARVYEGVLAKDVLDSRRGSPYFKNGYLRTQRVQEWENYQKRGGELNINRLRDDQHLSWGFEDDAPREFQDITFVLFDDVNQVAKQSIRKEEIGYLETLGEKVDVVVSGDEVKQVNKANATKERAVKTIEGTTKNVVKNMDASVFNNVFEYKIAKSAIGTASENAMSAGAKVGKANARRAELSDDAIKRMVKDPNIFTQEQIDYIVENKLGKPFYTLNENEFEAFLWTAPNDVKRMLKAAIGEANDDVLKYSTVGVETLPKIKTSDYTAITGLKRKDAPKWLQPFLSEKKGKSLDDIVGDMTGDASQYSSRSALWNDIESAYNDVVVTANRGKTLTYEGYNWFFGNANPEAAYELQQKINRSLVANNYDDIWAADSNFVRKYAESYEESKKIFDAETLYAENIKKLQELKEQFNLPGMATDLNRQMDEVIDGFVDANRKDKTTVEALKALDDSDDIVEYATLKSLTEKGNLKETKRKLRIVAEKEYNNILTANNKLIKLSDADSKRVEDSLKKMQSGAAPSVQRANDVFMARRHVNNIGGKAVPELDRATKMAELELEDAGYLINDYTGRKWNDGLNIDVISVEGEEMGYIIETIKPAVLKDGKIVQKAQVVVGSKKPKPTKPTGEVTEKLSGSQINRQAEQWAEQTVQWYEERVNQRFNQVTNRLREAKNDIVDYKDLFGRIQAINDEIVGASKADDIVKTYSDMGYEEYVRLSPTVADLITTMPTPLRRGMFGEIQSEFTKIFRMGTTGGLVPQSLIRQQLRDTGLATVAGNATRSTSEIEQTLVKVYGPTITEYYQKEMPDLWQTLLARAEETGEDIEKMVVGRELSRASTYTPDQMQSNLYQFNGQRRLAKNADGTYDQSAFDNIRDRLEGFAAKTEKLNNMRESSLRVKVYNNAYLDALNNGHSVPMARKYAEMIQAEATTNFSRQAYHLANLTKTVPYLGSAINGSKSFWRLMAMDPVGMTTRIVGGYLVPMIALTNMSIADPENREIYKSIPEYEKDDNLVFVLSGQKISIPIPQEISSLLRPIQSWIETMQGANDHSIEELTANNLAGFFPYELQGFVNVDADRILVDDEFDGVLQRHLLPGFSKLSSQMMAPLVKSGVMWATGYDPYTGKKIDTAYALTDPETGESVIIDYKAGGLATLLGNIFQGNFNVSADMAQAVFNNLLGTGNMNIIDGLTEIAMSVTTDEGIGAGLTSVAERFSEAAVKPLTISDYGEQSNQAWKRAVSTLYQQKEQIINDKEYQADVKALNSGNLTDEARSKIYGRIKTKKEEFQERVLSATKNLVKNYDGGTLDRYKFASVISLMTFSNGYSPDPTDPLTRQQSKESYNLARAKAVETMAAMGFDSPNDHSIFGYYEKNDKTGEIAVQFYSPLSILNFEKSSQLQDDVSLVNIKTIVNDAKLWDAHKSIQNQVNAIRSKGKLTKQAKADIDSIYINWNSQVAKEVAPYVARMTPEAAINNKAVKDYLHSLIEVPYSWSTNDKGKSVYLGDDGNRKDAYYESWIKSMFSINDKYKGQY